MRQIIAPLLVSNDAGLLKHWCKSLHLNSQNLIALSSFAELLHRGRRKEDIVWLDMNLHDVPSWNSEIWRNLIHAKELRVIAASSKPTDSAAIAALDAGCVGYCHAYSDSATLIQISQVIKAGHVWIGTNLMQQLIQSANRAASLPTVLPNNAWQTKLTAREREVAKLAAIGTSNLQIAEACDISERTVKAHMSAIFDKLGVSDRLQLALRVHGIQ
jgi:DNA-binding NarL/FixJ family response regulator